MSGKMSSMKGLEIFLREPSQLLSWKEMQIGIRTAVTVGICNCAITLIAFVKVMEMTLLWCWGIQYDEGWPDQLGPERSC